MQFNLLAATLKRKVPLDLGFCLEVKIQFVKNSIEVRYVKFLTEPVHSKHSCVAQSCYEPRNRPGTTASEQTISEATMRVTNRASGTTND